MIRLHIKRGLLGEEGQETVTVEPRRGLTAASLLAGFREHLPSSMHVAVAVDGQQIEGDALDVELRDGQQVMLAPLTDAPAVPYLLMLAASFAISYLMQQLSPRPKPQGVGSDRGDESSPTYAWDGIQTSYGQGLPVPWVYGRHAVGGQVIYTGLFATTGAGALDDRLHVILALSEGPIHAIGDTVATELNALGGLAGSGTPGVSLPSEIRVNGNLLGGPTNVAVRQITSFGLWIFSPTIRVGDQIQVKAPPFSSITGLLQVTAVNNAQFTDLDTIVLSGAVNVLDAIGLVGPNGVVVSSQTCASATNVIRTNQNPGARAWIRPGLLDQSEMPPDPFFGTAISFSPNASIDDFGAEVVTTYEATDSARSLRFVVAFPNGLYSLDPQGNPMAYPVTIECRWRPVGTTAWRTLYAPTTGAVVTQRTIGLTPRISPLVESFGLDIARAGDPSVAGPFEVQMVRTTPAGGTLAVSACVWRNLSVIAAHTMRYPRVALLGLELVAGSRFAGGLPNISVRIDALKVRVWDATHGMSPRTWGIPAAPFNFSVVGSIPGRNPAWILLDFLTSPWGLGKWIKESDLDLPSFRRWAAFCDADPSPSSPWGEPAFLCDIVGDAPRPAWEWVLAICAAGRASPIYRNGKIGVVYQYRDAHADFGISVAAKSPVQLITSGNCEKVQVTWTPKSNRATAFLFQFLNEDSLYAQDVLPVEDSEGTMNDPASLRRDEWRPETIQAYGVTRPSQVFREGMFRHRAQRLIRRELTFVTGRWALAAEVGDLIEFEHELLRPFSADVPLNMTVLVGGVGVTDIVIDHAAASATQIIIRDPDGKPQRRNISAAIVSGSTTTLTLTAVVTCNPGATCVVGLVDKLTQVYEIVAITLQRDMKREVRAVQWAPTIHDEVTPAMFAEGGSEDFIGQPEQEGEPDFADLRVVPNRDGSHLIVWSRPPNRQGVPARVYVREDQAGLWLLVGTTEGDEVTYRDFVAWRTYEVSVCAENAAGGPRIPDDGLRAIFTPEEFPPFNPPSITNASSVVLDDFLALQWDDLDVRDLEYYEVRIGSEWAAGDPVHRGRSNSVLLPNPPSSGGTILVAARSTSGLYGQPVALTVASWTPRNRVVVVSDDDFAPSPAGTHSNTQWNASGWIELQTGKLTGTYTSVEQDVTYQGPVYWAVKIDRAELEDITVEAMEFQCDSGEARWRTVNGRPASAAIPGVDWQSKVDDLTQTLDDLRPALLVQGHVGEKGTHTRVLVESRFYFNGAWTSYKAHRDRVVVASKMQVRVTLDRESSRFQVRCTALSFAGYL